MSDLEVKAMCVWAFQLPRMLFVYLLRGEGGGGGGGFKLQKMFSYYTIGFWNILIIVLFLQIPSSKLFLVNTVLNLNTVDSKQYCDMYLIVET